MSVSAALFLVLVGVSAGAWVYDGELDSSWSGNGLATWGDPGTVTTGRGIAMQCDGKILVAGVTNVGGDPSDLMVARFNSDGSLDTSFASAGIFTISPQSFGAAGWDVAVQPDEKIVVVGYSAQALSGTSFLVVRLTAAGVLDTSFSGDGIQIFNFGSHARAHAVEIQDDGGIVVVGETLNQTAIAVARLTLSGELDATFDTDGLATFDFIFGDDKGWDVVVQDDGRILVVGSASVGVDTVFVVLRLLTDGSLDTSFGSGAGGVAAVDFGTDSLGRAIALQPDGRMVVAGVTGNPTAMAVARLTSAGILDSSFSGDGKAIFDLNPGQETALDVAMMGDGRIIVVGSLTFDGFNYLALVRFSADGDLDLSFGGGTGWVPYLEDGAFGRGLVIQPVDRKVVASGFVENSVTEVFMKVIRVTGDGNLIFAADFECGNTDVWSTSVP
ncbi:MAG: hypothetical protein K8R59_06140 [Thermoanaerobaculales bacterium]|nr:hypothetical protein [Thermoanaerobaculales bacterium]